jgi:hypothetical protein
MSGNKPTRRTFLKAAVAAATIPCTGVSGSDLPRTGRPSDPLDLRKAEVTRDAPPFGFLPPSED